MAEKNVKSTFEKTQETAGEGVENPLNKKAQRISTILNRLPVKVLEDSKQGTMVIDVGAGNEKEARQIWEILLGYAQLHATLKSDEDGDTDFDKETASTPDLNSHTVLIHTDLWPRNWEMRLTYRAMYATDTPAARVRGITEQIEQKENQITSEP